nr:MAK10-like protein [Tanacetum cinerariifolium]
MEAHLAPKQLVQVKKITSSCEICSGPHDTQYCMKNPEQALVDYASSRTDEARAHLAPKQLVQVKKITSSCEICSGPHDTQYCMKNPEQALVDYASSRTDEAGGGEDRVILFVSAQERDNNGIPVHSGD